MLQQQDVFQKTEGMLYWYYEALRDIELMHGQAEKLHSRRQDLQEFQADYIESCAYQGAKGQYCSERVGGKKSIYHSSIDSAHEAVQDLAKEIPLLADNEAKLLSKISRNERETMAIQLAMGYLNKIDKDICEYKYRYHMSLDEIAQNVNMSKSAVRARRSKLVRCISDRLQSLQLVNVP